MILKTNLVFTCFSATSFRVFLLRFVYSNFKCFTVLVTSVSALNSCKMFCHALFFFSLMAHDVPLFSIITLYLKGRRRVDIEDYRKNTLKVSLKRDFTYLSTILNKFIFSFTVKLGVRFVWSSIVLKPLKTVNKIQNLNHTSKRNQTRLR